MDGFFDGIDQVEFEISGKKGKLPVFYRDARMFTLMLPAKLFKLYKVLPDPRFVPAQVIPGVGAVTLTAFEYFDTDIEPYNELSVGIVLNSPYYAPLPVYNLARQHLSRMYSVYVYHLPVTTEIALRGGVDFYNYPKFLADIVFTDSAERITCELSREGERILTMSGPKLPASAMEEMKFFCNLYHFKQPQLAEFKVNVINGALKFWPADASWTFSLSNSIGRQLYDLVLGSRALLYMYMPKAQFILYGPEHIPIPLMKRLATTQWFLEGQKTPTRKPAARKAAAKSPGKKAAGKASKKSR